MSKELSEYEEHLVELVHFLASGNKKQAGLNLREIKKFLTTPIKERGNQTPLQCIRISGRVFLNELKIYINEMEDHLK